MAGSSNGKIIFHNPRGVPSPRAITAAPAPMTPGPRTATYMATADDGVRRPPTVSNATDDDGV
ncbi:MAG: hypothetical protein LBP95_00900, partial [Deltaproteobacteria bacterium]|nr:hypothetical protein [Deltaproteobacteria bacterium]